MDRQNSAAKELISAGKCGQAVDLLREQTEEDPEDATAWRLLAKAHFELGNVASAAKAAAEVVKIAPKNSRDWCNLGMLLRKAGRLNEAETALRNALRLDRRNERARTEMRKVDSLVVAERAQEAVSNSAAQQTPPPPHPSASSETPAETENLSDGEVQAEETSHPNLGLGVLAFFIALAGTFVSFAAGGGEGPVLLVVATSIWMGVDCHNLTSSGCHVKTFTSPAAAVIGGLVLWIVCLPWYVVERERAVRACGRDDGLGQVFLYGGGAIALSAFLSYAVFGFGNAYSRATGSVSPPADVRQGERAPTPQAAPVDQSPSSSPAPSAAGSQSRPQSGHVGEWVRVQQFSGKSGYNTPPFTVGDQWAIKWSTQAAQVQGLGTMEANFIVAVKAPHSPDDFGDLVVNTVGNDSGQTMQYRGGTYYLEITAGQPWTLPLLERR